MLTLFLLSSVLLPYLTYSIVANRLNWQDRRQKNAIRHTNETSSALLLGTALYFLGGYAESFHWIIPLIATLTVVLYGFLSEFRSLQTSLLHMRSWTWQMWTITGGAVLLVLGFAALHVRYAINRWGTKIALGGYLGSFTLLPIFTATLIYGLVQTERSKGAIDDFEMTVGDDETGAILHDVDRPEHELGADSEDEDNEEDDDVDSLRNLPPQPIRAPGSRAIDIQRKLKVHLHHYQIFAYLALFARFPTIYSRVAAGLALGSMMHGVAAYGVDSIFEYEEIKS